MSGSTRVIVTLLAIAALLSAAIALDRALGGGDAAAIPADYREH